MSQIDLKIAGEDYETFPCVVCGARMMVHKDVRNQQRVGGGFSFCPNGHQVGTRPSDCEEERTRRERDRLKQENARLAEVANLNALERNKAQAEVKRLKTRASNGVCPCCHRTFKQLAAHMKNKHPEQTKALQ